MLQKERTELYHKVFDSVEGQKVLEDLYKKHYLYSPTYIKEDSDSSTCFREGQRTVVLAIQKILNKKETE